MAQENSRKERTGIVVSDAMDKTVVVTVSRRVTHVKYGKILRKNKKFVAHDEKNECKVGDIVTITETRPLSKTKRWRVSAIVTKAK
jgi:small subunit ribosomal protein S17